MLGAKYKTTSYSTVDHSSTRSTNWLNLSFREQRYLEWHVGQGVRNAYGWEYREQSPMKKYRVVSYNLIGGFRGIDLAQWLMLPFKDQAIALTTAVRRGSALKWKE